MRSLDEFSVECLEAMLRYEPGSCLGFADSSRKLVDGLSHSFRSAFRYLSQPSVFLAIYLALAAPFALAQSSTPSPANNAAAAANSNASTPVQPPLAGTANAEQLRLALQQGKADTAVLDWVLANSGQLKGDMNAGEMRIAFTITPAEGWWDKAGGGKLAWHEAPDGNIHLRIFVLDLADGRLVPDLTVRATLIDANANEQSVPADFGWYPLINAYGGNLPMDTDSSYTLRVTIDPMQPHHVFAASTHFEHPAIAEFSPVQITQEAVSELPLATDNGSANEAELLKPSNAALSAAITALWQQSVSGSEQPFGDYFVGYALNYSGLSKPLASSKLHLKKLIDLGGKDSVHFEILPRDSHTGRFIPGLKPQATLIAADGKPYGPGELILAWHQWLTHYGRVARIPRKGLYKLRVHFDAPGFRRWGRQSERFAVPADVEFDHISLNSE
jgi:hypothetical protein